MVFRIGGLASGMDTDTLIKQLMTAQRLPLEKLSQQKQTLQWQQEKYRSINSKIMELRNVAFDMKLQSNYLQRSASSSDDTSVSVSASAGALEGIHSIKINQLAKSAQLTSSTPVGAGTTGDATKLETLGLTANTELTIRGDKGSTTITVGKTDTIATLVNSINGKANATGVRVSFDKTLDRFFFTSAVTGENSRIGLSSKDGALLTDVFNLAAADIADVTAQRMTADRKFDVSETKIDKNMIGTQTIKIQYQSNTYNFTVSSSTTLKQFMDSINNSPLGSAGIRAEIGTDGKFAIDNPDPSKPLSITNQTVDSGQLPSGQANVLSTLSTINAKTYPWTAAIDPTMSKSQTLRIEYDGQPYDFNVTSSTTLGSLVNQINGSKLGQLGVSANIDEQGRFVLYNPDDSKSMALASFTTDGTPLPTGDKHLVFSLGLVDADGDSIVTNEDGIEYSTVEVTGQNALVEYDNIPGSYTSNTFSINGVTFNAKKETSTAVSVSVNQNADMIYNKIKSFVDKYNEISEFVNGILDEERNRAFTPLTDAQKEAMSEKEIELWESKAKNGLLRNDPLLSNALSKMRESLNSIVHGLPGGTLQGLSEIGITTGSYLERGKLYINEQKLRTAITDKPNEVLSLFTADDGISTSSRGDGLAVRMLTDTDGLLTQIKAKAGAEGSLSSSSQIGKKMTELDTSMARITDRLTAIEDRYYKQFAAMEKYINQLNSQGAYIANMFNRQNS